MNWCVTMIMRLFPINKIEKNYYRVILFIKNSHNFTVLCFLTTNDDLISGIFSGEKLIKSKIMRIT